MTREDRVAAIADNRAYADAVRARSPRHQGGRAPWSWSASRRASPRPTATGSRLAAACAGADRPGRRRAARRPRRMRRRLPPVLIGYGLRDAWYTADKAAGRSRPAPRSAGVEVTVVEFDGVHEWDERVRRRGRGRGWRPPYGGSPPDGGGYVAGAPRLPHGLGEPIGQRLDRERGRAFGLVVDQHVDLAPAGQRASRSVATTSPRIASSGSTSRLNGRNRSR